MVRDTLKICKTCETEKPFSEFHINKRQRYGYANNCKECRSASQHTRYQQNWFNSTYVLKKSYCRKNGIPFDLTPEYLQAIWTDECPVFKTPFEKHDKRSSWSPALDRIDPSKGYTQGNVVYISARANRIKYDASISELERIVDWYKTITTSQPIETISNRNLIS